MSNLLQPWICTYLIDVAETYGGNLTSVPLAEKNKKVQAIKVRAVFYLAALREYLRVEMESLCSSLRPTSPEMTAGFGQLYRTKAI